MKNKNNNNNNNNYNNNNKQYFYSAYPSVIQELYKSLTGSCHILKQESIKLLTKSLLKFKSFEPSFENLKVVWVIVQSQE